MAKITPLDTKMIQESKSTGAIRGPIKIKGLISSGGPLSFAPREDCIVVTMRTGLVSEGDLLPRRISPLY
jgi:hypothetical protein